MELAEVPYGYEALTKLPELPGIEARAYRSSKSSGQFAVPVPRVLVHRRTELPEVPGTGMSVLQKLQKFCVG